MVQELRLFTDSSIIDGILLILLLEHFFFYRDTSKAHKPGGTILWHKYAGMQRYVEGNQLDMTQGQNKVEIKIKIT